EQSDVEKQPDAKKQSGAGTRSETRNPSANPNQPENSGRSENAVQPEMHNPAEQTAYVYSFHTDENTVQLYSSRDLLADREQELMSQEEKLETLKAAGMLVDETHLHGSTRTEKERRGLIIFAVTAAAALSLSGILIRKRRK
ncbi:MAG: hypothetical protein Q4C73_12055, partial [Eubacteriales bacterium]|nr:hypothetical protein [Eubacteriales bacterium]